MTYFELKSEEGRHLLRRHGNCVILCIDTFAVHASDTELELQKALKYIKELETLQRVVMHLASNNVPSRSSSCLEIGVPLVKAYQQSTATNLHVTNLNLEDQDHLSFLTNSVVRSSITDVMVCGSGHRGRPVDPLSKEAKVALESLTALEGIGVKDGSLLPPLGQVAFPPCLQKFGGGVRSQAQADQYVGFLQRYPQIHTVSFYSLYRLSVPSSLVVAAIHNDSGLVLKRALFPRSASQGIVSGEFIDSLAKAILGLSPHLQEFKITLRTNGTLTPVRKQKLRAAMDKNNDLLALQSFEITTEPEDQEISSICRAFALKKTIARSAAGGKLSLQLLPLALNRI